MDKEVIDTFEIDYKDTGLDIIEKVNDALRDHGLKFVFDDLAHDGFDIVELVKFNKE